MFRFKKKCARGLAPAVLMLLGLGLVPGPWSLVPSASAQSYAWVQGVTFDNGNNPGQLRFFEDWGNGGHYLAFQSPAALDATVVWTLPDEDGSSGEALVTDGAGVLSWGAGGGGGSCATGPDGSVLLSDGSGGCKAITDFIFFTTGPNFYIPSDVVLSNGNPEIKMLDSGAFARRWMWVDGNDVMHFGLENAANSASRIMLHTLGNSITLPTLVPPDAGGNNFLTFSSSGVGAWDAVAALDVADDTTLETPRGVLNFGPTITVTDETVRLTAAVNMAASYIWTGAQNFDTDVVGVVSGSPTRDVRLFDRVEAWGTFSGPRMEWRSDPATPGVGSYWRAQSASAGGDLEWLRAGSTIAYWTASTFAFNGTVVPLTAGAGGVGSAGAPFGAAQIETITAGSSLQNGSVQWTNTVGNTHELFIGGSGNANLYLKPPLTDTNYGLFLQEPTSASANMVGLYTEAVSGSNQQGVVAVLNESGSTVGLLRSTSLQLSGTQVVTTRQAAVADASATVASVQTQLNALLARLRTHGLIAP